MALTDLTRISTSGIATGSTIDSPILRKDVDYRGSQVGVNTILFDSSDNSLKFKDSAKAKFGDSNDLEVYHDGSHSHIREVGTGDLRLRSSKILLMNENSQEYFVGTSGGSVELYFNDNQKFRTTNDGAVVTGILTASSFSGPIGNPSGISTFYDLRVTNNLTVEGTTTTLDTNLIDVDRVEIGANSNTNTAIVGIQSGTADIVNLFDGTTEVLTVTDGGNVGLGLTNPTTKLDVIGTVKATDINVGENISHIDDTDTKIVFTNNNIDLQTGGASRISASGYGLFVQTGLQLGFLASTGPSPSIKSGGTNNQDLLLTSGTSNPTRLSINVDGSVGIGTANATWGLSGAGGLIVGDGASSQAITIYSNPSNVGDLAFADAISGTARYRGLIRYDHDDNSFAIRTNSNERLRIDSDGRLLLGTALTTSAHGNQDDLIIKATDAGSAGITIVTGTSNQATIAFADGTSGDARYRGFVQYTHNGDKLALGTAGSDRLTILNDGKVGIGSETPSELLDIGGNTTVASNGRVNIYRPTSGSTNTAFQINSNVGGTDTTQFVIQAGGAVGINSTTPTTGYKLDVNGDLSLGEKGGVANTFIDQKQDGDLHLINSGRTANGASGSPGTAGVGINRFNNISGGTSLFRDFAVYNGKDSKVLVVDGSESAVGIGTDSPDQTLELFKASGTNLLKVTSQANSTVGLEIEKTGSTTQSWRIVDGQTANGKLEFYDVTDSATRMSIDGSGNIQVGSFTIVDTRNTGGIHIQPNKGISFRAYGSASDSRNWRIRNDDSGWGNLDFSVGDNNTTDIGNGAADTVLSLAANHNIGINNVAPDQRLKISGNVELNAYDSAGGSGGYYTSKGFIIGNAYDAGKTGLTDDRNSIIWSERGLDLDFATNDTFRMKLSHDGRIGIGTAIMDSSAEVSIVNASSSARVYMKSADNADCSIYFGSMNDSATAAIRYDHDVDTLRFYGYNNNQKLYIDDNSVIVASGRLHATRTQAKFGIDCHGLNIYDGINDPSNYGMAFYNDPTTDKANGIGFFNDDGQSCGGYIVHQDKGGSNIGDIVMATSASANTPVPRVRIKAGGGMQIGASSSGSFSSAGLILQTPAYSEYQYTWSGQSSYTIDLTCGSYFHSEVIYVQHQTNGGMDMQNYARMKWANNHYTHTGYMYEFSGQGTNAAVTTTFRVSDQNGGGEFDPKNGLTAAGSPGANYRGKYGGGQEDTSTRADGRLRISETYNGSGLSASSRAIIIRVYFGSFNISIS